MLTGNQQVGLVIPSRLIGQNIREWLLGGPAVTLKDGVVHLGRYENEAVKFYGSVTLVYWKELSAPWTAQAAQDPEFEITTSPDLLEFSYSTMDPEFLSSLKLTLSWISFTSRNEIEGSITLSTGPWSGDTFRLNVTDVADWHGSGWTKGISHAIVSCLDRIIPKAPLLSAVFPIACQLAVANTPLHIENGLILHGGFTALVPIELRKDGGILWDVEMRCDDFLSISEIKCLKRRWYQ